MVFIDRSGRFFPAGAAPTGVDVSVVIAMEIDTLLFLLFGLLEKIVLWNPLVVKGLWKEYAIAMSWPKKNIIGCSIVLVKQ